MYLLKAYTTLQFFVTVYRTNHYTIIFIKLGINIDHVATLRQARRETDPDPILAARICEQAGAHSIVAHLRDLGPLVAGKWVFYQLPTKFTYR